MNKEVVSADVVVNIDSRFPLLLIINHSHLLLGPKFIGCLRVAHGSTTDLGLVHLEDLLGVGLHLVGSEVVVAAEVLLAVLDFDLELFGGSSGGHLRVERLAPVEGVVELLEAAVLRLSLALLALRNGDRHRLLLVYVLHGTLQRTMARTLVSRIRRQIRLPPLDLFLLKLVCEWADVGAKVAADS